MSHPFLEQLRSLELPVAHHVLFGSGPLLARGWIDDAGDIDVVARGAAWARAQELGEVEYLAEWDVSVVAIGDAITIQFSRPLLMVLIAGLFLGEVVGRRRISVTLIGFLGIIMITRPFGGGFEPWVLVAVGGAVSSTLVALLIKMLTRTEDTLVIMFYFAFFTTLLAAIPALIAWQPPTALEWGLLILTGTFGIVGQSMFTHGLGTGETRFVLPFDYLRIVFGFIFGIAWLNEIPALWSYAGAATIVLSSIYLLKTEARRKT